MSAGCSIHGPHHTEDAAIINGIPQPQSYKVKYWKWWLMVIINISFVLLGQTVGNLLGRFYFNQGGNSKWMATLVVSAGFPILLPLNLLISLQDPTTTSVLYPSRIKITSIYIILGLMIAGSNLMYSYGLLYLPVSTFSLICASQLAFNVIFSYFLNSQKLTHLIINSVILITFSATLLGVGQSGSNSIPNENFPLGFILTLGASALFSLILSLMQLTFQRVLKSEAFSVVLEMQICTSIIATCTTLVGLFASGEWSTLRGEMGGYAKGRVSYIMTLVWTAVSWQMSGVGIIGLSFVVSSLFSNVISTVGLPIVPIFAVIFFHDKMDGIKVVSMLLAIWGFLSYIYQQYLNDLAVRKTKSDSIENFGNSSSQ